MERWAVTVVTHAPRTIGLPTDHAMHFGTDPGSLLAEADLVIVMETDVPWIPSLQHPPAGCRVAHMGEDPAFLRYPMRSFPCDLAITANPASAIAALETGNVAIQGHVLAVLMVSARIHRDAHVVQQGSQFERNPLR